MSHAKEERHTPNQNEPIYAHITADSVHAILDGVAPHWEHVGEPLERAQQTIRPDERSGGYTGPGWPSVEPMQPTHGRLWPTPSMTRPGAAEDWNELCAETTGPAPCDCDAGQDTHTNTCARVVEAGGDAWAQMWE